MKMIFEKFNPKIHDYHKIAEFIFDVDVRTYLEVFKTKKNAILAIEDLLLIYYSEDNTQKPDYTLYVVLENNDFEDFNPDNTENLNNKSKNKSKEYKNIIGMLQVVKKGKGGIFSDVFNFMTKMKLANALKFFYMFFLDSLVLANFTEDDLYIAGIAIDESRRGEGFGTKIIKGVIEKATEKEFKRIVLDTDFRNLGAFKLYESIGFKKFDEKSFKFLTIERKMYNMEYLID
jgi:ribosomal protein S18 acetylase RimI-like enzyme